MPAYVSRSRCSSGTAVAFRWYGSTPAEQGQDLESAVTAAVDALSHDDRVWNPWALTRVKGEIRDRLKAAARGELEPVDEIKAVDTKNPPPLYEIRWQAVGVTDLIGGNQVHYDVLLRMYHSEPVKAPAHFIGHHVHEKRTDVDDINKAQNLEIAIAKKRFDEGEPKNWGIAPSWLHV